MEFRLTYEGSLPSSGNTPHADAKHHLRKSFHPQLKKLWEVTPFLREAHVPAKFPDIKGGGTRVSFASGITVGRIDYLAQQFTRCNHRFVPLVTADLSLWCGLEILFLRQGVPGKVLKAGDIDGRIKTLFDGLKMPEQLQDLGKYKKPDIDEDPFFCLFQDDSLVSSVSVESDTLLESLIGGIPHPDDARVVIKVKLRPAVFNWGNMGFV